MKNSKTRTVLMVVALFLGVSTCAMAWTSELIGVWYSWCPDDPNDPVDVIVVAPGAGDTCIVTRDDTGIVGVGEVSDSYITYVIDTYYWSQDYPG